MNDETPTPVWLLTGFLGSGKTTVLAALLKHADLTDTAVIVNEFGEVGLDHHLVARGEEDNIVLLESGCLCCAVGDSLGETLTDLFYKRARGEIPAFSRVVIETTGMADPGPILRTFMADRVMLRRFALSGVICTFDALLGADVARRHQEARRQAAMADRVVITKADMASEADLASASQAVRALNPGAAILVSAHGAVDPAALLAPTDARAAPEEAADGHHHHHHDGSIETVFAPFPDALSWSDYAALVEHLRAYYGVGLLRAKGLLRIEGEDEPCVVQGVQHVFAPPAPLPRPIDNARTGLVLIGEGLEREAVLADLAAYGAAV